MEGVSNQIVYLTHLSSHKWHSPTSLFVCPLFIDFVVTDNCIFVEPNTEMKSEVLRLVVMGERGYKVHIETVIHWSLALDVDNLTHLKVR